MVRNILLVSSLFDFYLFEEEGLLYEQIRRLDDAPVFTRVSSGVEAVELLRGGAFDLVITTLHIEDMTPLRLARAIRATGVTTPLVLLAYDKRELADLITHHGAADFDRVFVWRGDYRLLIAIIRNLEDARRAEGPCVLVNEDSHRYASYLLPLLYADETRPRILLTATWEEATRAIDEHRTSLLGVITDAGFPHDGHHDPHAGIAFAREVKERLPHLPLLVQSTNPTLADEAADAGATFLWKGSLSFASDFRRVLRERFGFAGVDADAREQRRRGLLAEFDAGTFDPSTSLARTGGGSVGGKAHGLAFLNMLLGMHDVRTKFADLEVEVPAALVLGTDVFDAFVAANDLGDLASCDDEEIQRRFIDARVFPAEVTARLEEFLDLCCTPLAVRSSSLLEDTQFQPFAGIYQTYMIPNSGDDRLAQLLVAIKRVYASTFHRAAREYIRVTSLRAQDEKMAVIVQRMVGAAHGDRIYPEVSGVARSHNFYPVEPQRPEDGIVSVALGLGKTIVEGGASVRFSPVYPDHLHQSVRETQRTFYALARIGAHELRSVDDERIVAFDLRAAEEDGTLHWVASTYSAENDALYEGIARAGTRVVTFAPILRSGLVPLAEPMRFLLELGAKSIGTPVEIEFAIDLSGATKKLALLQMRPLVLSRELDEVIIDDVPHDALLCRSEQVLGHGAIHDLRDIVVVDAATFDRSRSLDAARELARINARLVSEERGYLLIGPGRWGSLDPLLGIPVKWDQIGGVRAIVETGFRDLSIDPSQGSHFFQNLTAFQVGYFSVNERLRNSFVDWAWLAAHAAAGGNALVRHIRLERGVTVRINGRARRGVVLK